MRKVNTLVVGQGLAGSVFSFMLHREHISFLVIDPAEDNSASMIAAGMFTPISGKRKTIHPLILQQIPFAKNFYREVETMLGCPLLHEQPVYHVFTSAAEREEFIIKIGQGNYGAHAKVGIVTPGNIQVEFGGVEINSSGWVDCRAFLLQWRKWLQENDSFLEGAFDHSRLNGNSKPMEYGGIDFENIVFCEGYMGMSNPFFADQSIIPCKGEVLTIEAPGVMENHIIKRSGFYLVPLGGETFRAGATYKWGTSSLEPDEGGRREIEATMGSVLTNDYKVVKHDTGIRPTTKNRDVIAAQHPTHKNMFMLNGLGTKGVLNAPWWAGALVEQYFKK